VRSAILILSVMAAFGPFARSADGPFVRINLESRIGYIVPETYASEHKADLLASVPGPVKITGFWTPSEQDVAVADRAFRDLIHAAAKDPTILFPDLAPSSDPAEPADPGKADQLEQERNELALVSENYDSYRRQYVGIIIDGQELVFCNYSAGTKADPADDYIFIQKVFLSDGTIHFLQCRFDPEAKTCSNVSMIGPWLK
jgi:hypothetical protein